VCITLYSGLDGCGLYLNLLPFNILSPSMCHIFRSGLFGQSDDQFQIRSLPVCMLYSGALPHSCCCWRLLVGLSLDQQPITFQTRINQQSPTAAVEANSVIDRPWPSSQDNRVLHNAGHGSITQFIEAYVFIIF
jgi:hypothetical protein